MTNDSGPEVPTRRDLLTAGGAVVGAGLVAGRTGSGREDPAETADGTATPTAAGTRRWDAGRRDREVTRNEN